MAAEVATREAYGNTLALLGEKNPDIVALDADLSKSTMTCVFAQKFPERFFDCGLAEQNMIGIAAGLAASGKIPFASTFAVFATSRCFDQLRMSVSQPGLNVKVVATHGGITVGEDGASHHAIEDLALTCSLPNFTVIVPADAIETDRAVRFATETEGPFYIRLSRPKSPVLFKEDYRFEPGKAVTMRSGNNATIIAIGLMVAPALQAAKKLAESGVSCRVLNMHTIKPIDRGAIARAARETGAIVTAEEHLEHGGLGGRVAQVVGEECPVPMSFVAMKDTCAHSGKPEQLLAQHRLTAADIEQAVRRVVARK
ncbi:MAG: transketolase family protein [Chloroflexi bacterium]|nr:transketolase family protein [Chloroflexota bacterium]